MILENGVVRTMDPSLPTARALAIAGAHVAGGVGTHEAALPSPDVVDLGGRCASRLHRLARPLPDLVAVAARRELEGVTRAGRGARARALASAPGTLDPRHRLALRRAGRRSRPRPRSTGSRATPRRSSGLRTTTPRGSTRPRSRGQAAISRSRAASSSATRRGEPTGVLREESAWQFRARFAMPSEDEFVDGDTRGPAYRATRAASSRCTTRTAGSARRASSSGSPSTRGSRCASGSRCRTSGCRARGARHPLAASATTSCASAT